MSEKKSVSTLKKDRWAKGACLCGKVVFEIKVPARWAFHCHCEECRTANGAGCSTNVGSWRKRFRMIDGESAIKRVSSSVHGQRSFCADCGSSLFFESPRSPHMINISRGLFSTRVGREPRYHLHFGDRPDWAYDGGKVAPMKEWPHVMYERPKKPRERSL